MAHADSVNIYNGLDTGNISHQLPKSSDLIFKFEISFAEENVEIDVITKEGVNKVFYDNCRSYTWCKSNGWTNETKNQIMKWYGAGGKDTFTVTIEDKRIEYTKSLYADIEAKLASNDELSLEEQVRYSNLGRLIEIFQSERRAKEKAVAVYLKDRIFQAYCHVGFYSDLLYMIKEILDFPYRLGFYHGEKYQETFVAFDVFTGSVPNEYSGSFVANLLKSDVVEAYKRDGLLLFPDSFVLDWGIEMAKKIAVQYYVHYIGREIIKYNRSILGSDEYLDTQNASIQYWHIGPH